MTTPSADPLDRTFHALGDSTRRSMLEMLSQRGECTASELGEPFDIAQPTASRHIRVLESSGLVTRNVSGRVHRFLICPTHLDEAQSWFSRHRQLWQQSLASLENLLDALPAKKPTRKKPTQKKRATKKRKS